MRALTPLTFLLQRQRGGLCSFQMFMNKLSFDHVGLTVWKLITIDRRLLITVSSSSTSGWSTMARVAWGGGGGIPTWNFSHETRWCLCGTTLWEIFAGTIGHFFGSRRHFYTHALVVVWVRYRQIYEWARPTHTRCSLTLPSPNTHELFQGKLWHSFWVKAKRFKRSGETFARTRNTVLHPSFSELLRQSNAPKEDFTDASASIFRYLLW